MSDTVISLKDWLNNKENAVIDRSTKTGDRIAFDLFNYEPDGTDNTAILFSVWTTILTQLILRGWSKNDLEKELDFYEQVAGDIKRDL
jgi:hypothetical protein